MNTRNNKSFVEVAETKWIYRVGAVSSLLVLIGYIATFPIYAWVGNPPSVGLENQLVYFADNALGWWIITGLMVVTDLLLIPLFLALYQSLKDVQKNMMVIALAFVYLFVALDLSITWTAFSELIVSGGKLILTTDDAEKAALIAGASHASNMLDLPLGGVYAIVFPAVGVLLTSLVILRGGFGKLTGYLGVVMGITGIAYLSSYFIESLVILKYINALIATAWYGFVCAKFIKKWR